MTCTQCQAIAVHHCDPAKKDTFNPACLWCGSRAIQFIQRSLALSRDAKAQRCREVLTDWGALGHSETELRRLAKLAAWAVAPADRVTKK